MAVLRAAVKFSMLQSYEFVPDETVLFPLRSSAGGLFSSSFVLLFFCVSHPSLHPPPDPLPLFLSSVSRAAEPELDVALSTSSSSSSSFDDYTALYDTRYPSSEILCLAEPRWPSPLVRCTRPTLFPPPVSLQILYSRPANGRTHRCTRTVRTCSNDQEIILKP